MIKRLRTTSYSAVDKSINLFKQNITYKQVKIKSLWKESILTQHKMAQQLKYTSNCKLGHSISKQKEKGSVRPIIVNLFFLS